MIFVIFLLNLLPFLSCQAIEKTPNDILFGYILPQIGLYDDIRTKPLPTLTNIKKENFYDDDAYHQQATTLLNQYIKIVKILSCNSWYANYLSKDVISLASACHELYRKIFTKYENEVDQYRKNQLCILFKALGVDNRQLAQVHALNSCNSFNYYVKKSLCAKECTLEEEAVLLRYYTNYDEITNNINIILDFKIGHGFCQKDEIFLATQELFNDPRNLQFNCEKFGEFLYEAADYTIENEHTLATIFAVAYYIKKQPNLPLKCKEFTNVFNRNHLMSFIPTNQKKMSLNQAIVKRNTNLPGRKFITLNFSIDIKRKNVLKLFQLLSMCYTWDVENSQIHRIFNNFTKSYPKTRSVEDDVKFCKRLDLGNRNPAIDKILTTLSTQSNPNKANLLTNKTELPLNIKRSHPFKKTLNNTTLHLIIVILFLFYTFTNGKHLTSNTI